MWLKTTTPCVRVVVRQLGELGYHVLEAVDAGRAGDLNRGTRVDLLFTDHRHAGKLTDSIWPRGHRAWSNLKIVLTSGFPETKSMVGRVRDRRASPVLSRPYRKEELARPLRSALRVAAARNHRKYANPAHWQGTC